MGNSLKKAFENLPMDLSPQASIESIKNAPRNKSPGAHIFKSGSAIRFGYGATSVNRTHDNEINRHMEAKKSEAYVFRAYNNSAFKMAINDYALNCENNNSLNLKRAELFSKYFDLLLIKSGYTFKTFMFEIIKNSFHGNVYIHAPINKDGIIDKITVMPSKGWSSLESKGYEITKFAYDCPNGSGTFEGKTLTNKEIIHLKFNCETHELFGHPLLLAALDDLSSLRTLENKTLEHSFDVLSSIVYTSVGDTNAPATANEINELTNYYDTLDEDEHIIINGKAKLNVLDKKFVDVSPALEFLQQRVFSSLGTSKTVLGDNQVGRQTADTESENDDVNVSSLQIQICDQLNQKLFVSLNLSLFPDITSLKDFVFIVPNEPFNIKERKEKHTALMYQSNFYDLDKVEQFTKRKININKTHGKLYEKEPNGQVGQKSDPANQTGKRGSSKKSKKDFFE